MLFLRNISAFDLCSRVLDATRGDASRLIELAGGKETDWLEFKASCEPPAEGPEEGTTADYYRWHVARAVIAMANTCGGVLLLGVDDNGRPTGLEATDPRGLIAKGGMDAFLRHLGDVLFKREVGWKCGRHGAIQLNDSLLESHVEYRRATLSGVPIVALLVRPIPAEAAYICCSERLGDSRRYFLLVRQAGETGRVMEISHPKEMADYAETRRPGSPHFASLLARFMISEKPNWRRRLAVGCLVLVALGLLTWWIATRWPPPQTADFVTIQTNGVVLTFSGDTKGLDATVLTALAERLHADSQRLSIDERLRIALDRTRHMLTKVGVPDRMIDRLPRDDRLPLHQIREGGIVMDAHGSLAPIEPLGADGLFNAMARELRDKGFRIQ